MSQPPDPNAAHVLEFVRDTDVPCPVCAYNLRSQPHPQCPECGEPLRLRVSLQHGRLALWLTMVLPVLAVSGMGMLLTVIICLRGGVEDIFHGSQLVFAILFIATLPLGGLALISRRWFCRLSSSKRVSLAVSSVLVSTAFLVTGGLVFR